MARCIAAAVALALTLTSCATSEPRFREACAKAGGFVAVTDSGFWSTRIDCIVDNEVVYLPGFT